MRLSMVGFVRNLAVNMILGTSFTSRILRGIFPVKRKVVSCHSHLDEILLATQRDLHSRTSTLPVAAPLGKPSTNDKAKTHQIRIAQQTLLKLQNKHTGMVTTTASEISTVEP